VTRFVNAVSGCVAVAAAVIIAGCASLASSGPGATASSSATSAGGSAAAGSSSASGGITSSSTASVSAASNSASTPAGPSQSPVDTRQPRPTSPILFLGEQGALVEQPPPPGEVVLNGADGQTRDGDPYRPVVFTASDLWLDYTEGTASFVIPIDAGQNIGSGTQLRMSADLTGDGTWDRVETFHYFATDPLPGAELYTQDFGILSSKGEWGDLRGGIVQVEIWSTLGDNGSTIELGDASVIQLPYS